MLPGKVYKPEDILAIIRKRFWFIVVPFAIVSAVTAFVARKLPDMYRSYALIRVEPPRVAGNIGLAPAPVRLDDRLSAIQQTILTRTRLEGLIREFDLYKDEQRTGIMQDVVDGMRQDIRVDPTRGDSFTVTFHGRNPTTVAAVTARLAGFFIEQSVRDNARRAEDTSTALESQVEEARRKLLDTEQKVTQYKTKFTGELPSQLSSNLQAMGQIQANIQSLVQSMNNDAITKLGLERQIASLEGQADPGSAPVTRVDPDAPGSSTAIRLEAARQALTAHQARGMLPTHPTYRTVEKIIKDLEAQLEKESLRSPVGTGGGLSPIEQARQRQLAGLRQDLEQLKKQISEKTAEEKRLRGLAAAYQARVDRVPAREADMLDIDREYEVQKRIYDELVASRERANMSVTLERRQMGELFTMIEPARRPEKPYSPDRLRINVLGLLGGLALGLALVALLEYRDGIVPA